MKEIALIGKRGQGKFALVDDEDYERINKYKWYLTKDGYPVRSNYIQRKQKYITMHREVLNFPNYKTDHKNRNALDNTKENLRPATQAQNCANRSKLKNKTSKYKGVHFDKDANKWKAAIKTQGKCITLGRFSLEIDAAKAYNKKALELFGEFACLNIIE